MRDEQRLGDVLAAIGNHEAKALTFLAMREDEAYGVTSVYRRFLEIQGSPPAFAGQVTMAQKYVVHSFAPIGLVAKQRNEGGFLRHVKHDPYGHAEALAGFLLAHTEDHPAALTQIFGKTATNGLDVSDDRPPIRRLRLLRVLAEHGAALHAAELADLAGLREVPAADGLRAFAAAGLLDYTAPATYDMRTVYRVTKPIVFDRRGNTAMRDFLAEHLNTLLAASGGVVEVEREELEAELLRVERWQQAAALRDQVQGVMKRMVAARQVEAVSAHYGPTHSVVTMTDAQHAFIAGLVAGIDAIGRGDEAAVAAGRAAGRAIVEDPERVRPLIRRAFAASKLASHPISEADKLRGVLAAVTAAPGSTSIQLLEGLGPAYTKALLAGTLHTLVKDGKVRGEQQPDGPYKRWYPAA